MNDPVRILVVGCGQMGRSHLKAYAAMEGFEVAGLVNRSRGPIEKALEIVGHDVPCFSDYKAALETGTYDAVSINTYPDTHAEYAVAAMAHGADVFMEKPIGVTVEEAKRVQATAQRTRRVLLVGYILRHHPSWVTFVKEARKLGTPLIMRMNLNQQSTGDAWTIHRELMRSASPIVDCGVHYVDVMCQMTGVTPVRVAAIGARVSDEIDETMYNYGNLQVTFSDGSVGWYEAGWGPMMSENAYFIKDVIGPAGSVSMKGADEASADVSGHTKTGSILVHSAAEDVADRTIDTHEEPEHDELCAFEQRAFLEAIAERRDMSDHIEDAVRSLAVVLAADESVRTGRVVEL